MPEKELFHEIVRKIVREASRSSLISRQVHPGATQDDKSAIWPVIEGAGIGTHLNNFRAEI